MRKSGGSIVLVSSVAARLGMANHEAIAAAKAGIEGLARSAAASGAWSGIRVNVVAPSLLDTPMAAGILSSDLGRRVAVAAHPLGKIGRAEDVASAIAWLVNSKNSWVTGQTIGVDGGLGSLQARVRM